MASTANAVAFDPSSASAVVAPGPSWLPASVCATPGGVQVRWLHFGAAPLSEPFFRQSVARARRSGQSGQPLLTPVEALRNVAEERAPAGFVFHVSRCGSTLLANALRCLPGATVISEAQPVSALLAAPDLLAGAVRAYGRRRRGNESGLFFKFSSWNVLHIAVLQRLWPRTPCLFLIRDPVEVMVSCLKEPPGWLRLKSRPAAAAARFGWNPPEIAAMTGAEYCARGIAAFLRAMSGHANENCRVVDYRQLDIDCFFRVVEFFGESPATASRAAVERTFQISAKDPTGTTSFVPDCDEKRRAATPAIRLAAERWAEPVYECLKSAHSL